MRDIRTNPAATAAFSGIPKVLARTVMALKTQNNGFLATSGGGDSVSQRQRRFADARGAEEQDIGPTIERFAVPGRDHAREHFESPAPDVKVMGPVLKSIPRILRTRRRRRDAPQPTPSWSNWTTPCTRERTCWSLSSAELPSSMTRVQSRRVKKCLSHHLTPVAEDSLCQRPKLRQAVENEAGRVDRGDPVENQLRGFAELQFGGTKDGKPLVRRAWFPEKSARTG